MKQDSEYIGLPMVILSHLLGTVGANNNAFTDMTTAPLTLYYYYVVGYQWRWRRGEE